MGAAVGWIAGVVGTRVTVVAIESRAAGAGAVGTDIVRSTGRAVVARCRIVSITAAVYRVTGVVGARIAIVTIRLGGSAGTLACAGYAGVIH